MSTNILIAYASIQGSTAGVADAIAEELRAGGATVTVEKIKHVKSLEGYDGVIVGSAIRAGNWLSGAKKFVAQHQAELSKQPLAYFTVCLTLEQDTEENRKIVAAYLDPIRQIVEPASVGLFAGAMDYAKLSWPVRQIIKSMKSPQGDFRNWDAIKTWAHELRPIFGLTSGQ
jgi:menaquinone-dependent protoporphyrinogen oxidase